MRQYMLCMCEPSVMASFSSLSFTFYQNLFCDLCLPPPLPLYIGVTAAAAHRPPRDSRGRHSSAITWKETGSQLSVPDMRSKSFRHVYIRNLHQECITVMHAATIRKNHPFRSVMTVMMINVIFVRHQSHTIRSNEKTKLKKEEMECATVHAEYLCGSDVSAPLCYCRNMV